MERREFIQLSLKSGAIITVPLIFSFCSKDDDPDPLPPGESLVIDMDLSQFSKLKTDGQFIIEENVIVANLGGGDYVALSAICTHDSCIIEYNHAAKNFPCPCHGSVYSTNGSVIEGPAPTGVKKYNVAKQGNVLTITA